MQKITATSQVDSAYLMTIDLDVVEDLRFGFRAAMAEAKHSADIKVTVNGESKEFRCSDFAKMLGFKVEREPLRNAVERLRNEVNCRIEHGAESSGHLAYVHFLLTKILIGDDDE